MEKKEYKCKACDAKSTIITLGELSYGCLDCGERAGFLVRNSPKGKWKDYKFTWGAQKLSKYLQ